LAAFGDFYHQFGISGEAPDATVADRKQAEANQRETYALIVCFFKDSGGLSRPGDGHRVAGLTVACNFLHIDYTIAWLNTQYVFDGQLLVKNFLLQLVLLPMLLLAGDAASAQNGFVIDSRMTGSWYDPAKNGQGFLLEVLGDDKALIYWFTYDESGRQRWFIGEGGVSGSAIVFNQLLAGSGTVFGDDFDPEDVEFVRVGELSITWSDCDTAVASYRLDEVSGSQSLVRLSAVTGLGCADSAPLSSPSHLTGSWFDQTHNGEGLVVEALTGGQALVFWFSYDDTGQPAWFFGLGDSGNQTIVVDEMYRTSGGLFGDGFDPGQVKVEPWGSVLLELGCDFGKLDFSSPLSEFAVGKQTLTRLTQPGDPACTEPESPNILLIIADDLGLDASNQYGISGRGPNTPVLDGLADAGLVFENAWSNPTCSPTRAGILTGKYGSRTGVMEVGDVLPASETSLQSYIRERLPGKYADAVIGKWHLGPLGNDYEHPAEMGISHFAGILGGGVPDYERWELTVNGEQSTETEYVTSKLVDLADEWVSQQEKPWFLWLAFNAPHTPLHLPPADLHSQALPGTDADIDDNPLDYYFAAIEAMDTEIGRLLDSLSEEVRNNTIVLFVGDNGTPGIVAQEPFSRRKAKDSLYQGGINVPVFVTGPGIERKGEREQALINTTDLFSTIAALAGVNVAVVNDSWSFTDLLSSEAEHGRRFQFSEMVKEQVESWAVSDGEYKLIETESGAQELYLLTTDPFENYELISRGLAPQSVVDDLQSIAAEIRLDR